MDTADVIFMQDNLIKIPMFLEISKEAVRKIKQNLFWASSYNICMILLAMGGGQALGISMKPMIAGVTMVLSSFLVVFNALRLKKLEREMRYFLEVIIY